MIASFADLTQKLGVLSNLTPTLERGVFNVIAGVKDDQFANNIESLRSVLHDLDADAKSLSSAFSLAGGTMPGSIDLFALQTKLRSVEDFLDVFSPWFRDTAPHHVLVLLQNPAELRPTGGFLGSYADVTIASGVITDITVHDITDVDDGWKPLIVPPKPLQLEVPKWRPADANWFFDVPTSASQTISFFERSELYAASGTKFDGVVFLSSKVIADLFSVTGPITVSSTASGQTKTTFTADNFLIQIQKIVQDNLAAQNSGTRRSKNLLYPKQIIGDLADVVFARLASSTEDQRRDLFNMAMSWAGDKDLTAYFKDAAFERFAMSWGAGGEVYDLPYDFEGDYLALASINVNGQKSDLYVSENVNWQSQINDDGTVSDHLSVTRVHAGDKSPYWWYQAPNQVYFQLFTTPGSTLTNASGGVVRTVPAPLDYAKAGYTTDPLVLRIESSTEPIVGIPAVALHKESGKDVFATWSRVAGGKTTTLSFDYTHRLFLPIADGTVYQFIFEKQPGTKRHYLFEIDAPLGYVFKETNLASWSLEADDISGRLVQNLTLEKIRQ